LIWIGSGSYLRSFDVPHAGEEPAQQPENEKAHGRAGGFFETDSREGPGH